MLSIVIPTLNEEKHIKEAIDLIKDENLDNFEIVIADAGSTDKTKEIVEKEGCRVVKGGLPAVGRNLGAKAAKGENILFLDADLVSIDKETLKEGLKQFKERDLDIASFPILISGEKIDKFYYTVYNKWAESLENLEPQASQAILVKKSLHDKLGGFNKNIKLAEDFDYVNRARKIGFYGRLKTQPIIFSARRILSDGRWFYFKYLIAGWLIKWFKPLAEKNVLEYRFDHYSKKKKRFSKKSF
jgi:glycosyltransferase involved in cell wall biosynthesis